MGRSGPARKTFSGTFSCNANSPSSCAVSGYRSQAPISIERSVGMLRTSRSLTVFCVCFFLLPVLAQQTKLAEPDVMDVVYLRDASDQALKPLPKQPAKVVTHRGFASAKGAIQIPGPASSFRIKAGAELEFVVKSASPESYQLFAFTKKGDNREAVVANAKASLFGGVS